jgi:hypothetical protein
MSCPAPWRRLAIDPKTFLRALAALALAAVVSGAQAQDSLPFPPKKSGFGQIAELSNDWDGYTGRLPPTTDTTDTTDTTAKVLGHYGYKTAAFGKLHNTPAEETTQQGPFDRWPTGRQAGFDYF